MFCFLRLSLTYLLWLVPILIPICVIIFVYHWTVTLKMNYSVRAWKKKCCLMQSLLYAIHTPVNILNCYNWVKKIICFHAKIRDVPFVLCNIIRLGELIQLDEGIRMSWVSVWHYTVHLSLCLGLEPRISLHPLRNFFFS